MIPIVLIPGVNGTAETFGPQIVSLWPFGPITIASTLEGDTIAEMAAAILRDAPPRFALVGFSMGGYIAFEIMRQAPERVLKLALIDTSARPDTPEQTRARRIGIERMGKEDPEKLRRETEARILHPSHVGDGKIHAIGMHAAEQIGNEAARRHQEACITRIDSRPTLKTITVPTVVIVGAEDLTTPPELAFEMADAIPGARLVVVAECGHLSLLEQPRAVIRALKAWLEH